MLFQAQFKIPARAAPCLRHLPYMPFWVAGQRNDSCPVAELGREADAHLQGDVSEGTLTSEEPAEDDTSAGRAQRSTEAGGSGASIWSEDFQVRLKQILL